MRCEVRLREPCAGFCVGFG